MKCFICDRLNFIFNSVIYFEPVKRFKNRKYVMIYMNFGYMTITSGIDNKNLFRGRTSSSSLVPGAATSRILSSRSRPFSTRAAASHIYVTVATSYFIANCILLLSRRIDKYIVAW
jgi:hypothetical protein